LAKEQWLSLTIFTIEYVFRLRLTSFPISFSRSKPPLIHFEADAALVEVLCVGESSFADRPPPPPPSPLEVAFKRLRFASFVSLKISKYRFPLHVRSVLREFLAGEEATAGDDCTDDGRDGKSNGDGEDKNGRER
jgi:hypothetical protein